MASLSLPRVLQLKKNSLDAEREQFEKFQTLAIQKAINAIETPVKEKHVRSTIIGTFQEQSAITYWLVAVRLPIQDNRIVAWKFCHVTHKLLREGHPACLDDSQRHISMIENLGKLWVHLREGYGKLVHLYSNLLVCKLKFHSRNPRFPGNMQLTTDELDAIAENDVNNYFQLCVELFDYMDEILNLQASVFDSLGNARANSMTASGQCRLAALIPCAQDSSQIYDCNVRLLFRLHASLPADTLAGHRERFRQQFKKLSSFYKHASSLQYYRNLLTLPVLPSNPPNFLQQSDFGTYVTPVVSIPEPSPDEMDAVASLIDTSDTISQAPSDHMEEFESRPSASPQPDPIVERDRLIDHLQNELKRMRSEVSQLVQERNTMIGSMREHCTKIESQLHNAKVQLEEEKHRAETLSAQTPQIQQKLSETTEKAKVQDEKFQKLKSAYTQLREEHITLIRQKAEVDKLSASLRAATAQQESAKLALQQQLDDRIKDVELLQQNASSSEEVEAYKAQITHLRADIEQARQKEIELESVRAAMEALEIEHKTATQEQEERITTITNELKETTENLEKLKQEKEEGDTELIRVKEELIGLREKSGDEYKMVVEEKEAALNQIAELKQQHLQEKEELNRMHDSINELQSELDGLRQKITITETDHESERHKLNQEILMKNEEINQVISEKELAVKETLEKLHELEQELEARVTEVTTLQKQVNELLEYKKSGEEFKIQSLAERKAMSDQLSIESETKAKALDDLKEKVAYISDLESKLKYLELDKNFEIVEMHEDSEKAINDKNEEIDALNIVIAEKDDYIRNQKTELEMSLKQITELNNKVESKTTEITELNVKLEETLSDLKQQKLEYDNSLKESKFEVTILKDKLQNVIESKDEIVANLKTIITEKDEQVISLNVELTKLTEEKLRLKDELEETRAELEIGNNELLTLRDEHEVVVVSNEDNLTLKNQELRKLQEIINEITEQKDELQTENTELITKKEVLETNIVELRETYETLKSTHDTLKYEKETLTIDLNNEIVKLKMDYRHLENDKDNEIQTLNEKILDLESFHDKEISQRNEAITLADTNLQTMKEELVKLQDLVTTERQNMEVILSEKDLEKQVLEKNIIELNELHEFKVEVTILKDKLQNALESKDEIVANLKTMIAEKDEQVISLNVELTKLTEEKLRLKDELEETRAELEIGNNELLTLRDEHEVVVVSNEDNLTLKNQELRKLQEIINEITKQKDELQTENTELITKKEVLETNIVELRETYDTFNSTHDTLKYEKELLNIDLNNEINKLKMDYRHLKDDTDNEIQTLNEKILDLESFHDKEISQRNEAITLADTNLQTMKEELVKLQDLVTTERQNTEVILSEKDLEKQMLENKIDLVESKRLNAECELQDLLQHNTVLEADLVAVKKQLEEAKKALEKQSSLLVTCAGEAALEVTKEAINAFEQANTHDTVMTSAESAAKALELLARHSNVTGNEESIAKSAIVAAHNTAQLSAYVTDVSNTSTNIALSDKLQNECRIMLSATKECLESVKSGSVVSKSCTEAQSLVRSMMTSAAAADRQNSGARSVDDELADMDRAIEEAASQIESMLAATRAGDSGVKLEVNGKILDACTTLMGAVKILVQDARKLQNELGDPKTRQKMYRKNPQWSEGLISAAKAVVFAAKLLVTSADEAVGASGQVEGVSAAAHEVAGSTAQLVAASRARAPPDSPALARLTHASRSVAAATGALVAAVKAGSTLVLEQEALDTSALSLTATRRLEMESKVRSLKLETALDAERARLAALRKRHYQLAQQEENGNMGNGKD